VRQIIRSIALVLALLAVPALAETSSPALAQENDGGVTKLEQARALVAERQAVRHGTTQGASEPELTTSVGSSAVKLFSALGIALAAFFIGMHLHRRMTGASRPPRSRRLRIIERLPIAGKTALVLVEVDGRPLVLTVGADRVTALESPGTELTDVERLCRDEAALVAVGS